MKPRKWRIQTVSFTASPMWGVIGVPTTKVPISGAMFGSYVLPPLLFYFVMAVLTITPQTRALRAACLALVALLALRAAVSVDMSLSCFNERKFHNDLAIPMLIIVTRTLHWALGNEPLVRRLRPANSTPSTLVDALDLASNFRGYGWDWSRGVYIPRDTRPSSRTGFIFYVTVSAALHAFICGTLHRAIQSFSPIGLGSVSGGSIFDETVPLHVRYLRSTTISIIGCFATYSLLQTCYDLCTMLAILILRQEPTQWPPAFDAPWRATSLADFWGRRWHQWLRNIFLIMSYPLSSVFGRVGLVVGAFLSSSVFHHVGLRSFDTTSELWRILIGFGMMAPVILVERAFKQLTGRKVCGLAGWVWTMTWLILLGNVIIDSFVRAGLFKCCTFIDGVPSLRTVVEHLVIDFDTWLHTV